MAMFPSILGVMQHQCWVCTNPLLLPMDNIGDSTLGLHNGNTDAWCEWDPTPRNNSIKLWIKCSQNPVCVRVQTTFTGMTKQEFPHCQSHSYCGRDILKFKLNFCRLAPRSLFCQAPNHRQKLCSGAVQQRQDQLFKTLGEPKRNFVTLVEAKWGGGMAHPRGIFFSWPYRFKPRNKDVYNTARENLCHVTAAILSQISACHVGKFSFYRPV